MDAVCPRCKTTFPGSRSIRFKCFLCNEEVCAHCSSAQGFAHVEDGRRPRGTHLCCNDCHHRGLNSRIKRETEPVSFEECARVLLLLMADSGILDAREFIKQVEDREVRARGTKRSRRR